MLNKFSIKLIGLLCAISVAICCGFTTFAEDIDVVSSTETDSVSSQPEVTSSEETPAVSSEQITVSSPDDDAQSEVVSSNNTESVTVSKAQSVVSKNNVATASKPSVGKPTSSKSNVSSKNSSSKNTIVVKESSVTVKVNSDQTPAADYTTSSEYIYESHVEDNESISDKWDGKETEIVSDESTSSSRQLSKHLTDPKKAMMKWIWLPVLLGLACIAFLVYYNVYYLKNSGSHSKKNKTEINTDTDSGENTEESDFFDFDNELDEPVAEEDEKTQTDPFSAENFFNFDNE